MSEENSPNLSLNDAEKSNSETNKTVSRNDPIEGLKREEENEKESKNDASESSKPKRSAEITSESNKRCRTVIDLAEKMGLKAGIRLEVEWQLDNGDDTKEEDRPTRWWGATLLEHDGRLYEETNVAIRVLEYDPCPDWGYPEASREDVIFMGTNTLANPTTEEQLNYRLEDGGDIENLSHEEMEERVNSILTAALQQHSQRWSKLDRAQQAHVAELIASKKEKLIQLLTNHQGLVTADDMKAILQETMNE